VPRNLPEPVSFVRAAADFRDGRTTPRRFLERCLEAISRHDRTIKAFVTLDARGARKAADAATRRYEQARPLSPVDGCPIAVKDIIATADMPTEMNSPIYRKWRPKADAACVMALRRAGAIVIGKTVTTEFAIGRSGPTRNPFDPTRTPGGSSSGSAAAVACGMAPAALGTQTVGSVLRPAAYCGVVGFKPTHGGLPTGGIHLLSPTSDHLGVIAATVEDAWLVASQISVAAASPGIGLMGGAAGIALGWVVNLVQRGEASMGRLLALLQEQPAIVSPAASSRLPEARGGRTVKYEGVWFRYPNAPERGWVLQDIDFTVDTTHNFRGSAFVVPGSEGVA